MRKIQNKSRDNFDIIREYVSGENPDIELNDVQQKQLRRWNFYINLKLQGELSTRDIVKKMMDQFDVERSTCFNDMGMAEALFGYSASLNKRFRIGARIDFLEEKINELWNTDIYKFKEGEGKGDAIQLHLEDIQARHELAAKLENTLQKYYDIYPEMKQQKSPRIINYNFTKNEYNINELPEEEEAVEILKNQIKDYEPNEE